MMRQYLIAAFLLGAFSGGLCQIKPVNQIAGQIEDVYTIRPPATTTTAAPATTTTPRYLDTNVDAFFRQWEQSRERNISYYLSAYQASWFYSLGSYRPPPSYEEPPTYPRQYRPEYSYPPYPTGGGGGTGDGVCCDLIPGPVRTRKEYR